jgi:acyl carrier protein
MPTVEEAVLGYLNESKLISTEVQLNHLLSDDLAMDSLDVIELTMHLEEKLGITVDDDDDNIRLSDTVGHLIDSIRDKYGID